MISTETQKIQAYNLFRRNSLQFFKEMPRKLSNAFEALNLEAMTVIALNKKIYDTVYRQLEKAGILRIDDCSAEQRSLKILLKPASDVPKFFNAAINALYPPEKSKKNNARQPVPAKKLPLVAPTPIDATAEDLRPLLYISNHWKESQKSYTARKQRGNKSAGDKKSKRKVSFFIDQHRVIPEKTTWLDAGFGELVFDRSQHASEILVMRNEHNCGKPVFGYLPIDSIRTVLSKHYKAEECEKILEEISKTFSEAKQAGFFGHGIKACPNLPLLCRTPYKLEIKPSRDFKPVIRVFGRHINNGEHTLFIFDALDRNPKSSASKLEVVSPEVSSAPTSGL